VFLLLTQSTDAVPKKRGPKTDVLEALLKRVDGLERQLGAEKKKSHSPNNDDSSGAAEEADDDKPKRPQLETTNILDETAVCSPDPIE